MNSALLSSLSLLTRFDPQTGQLEGSRTTERRLSDLSGCFANIHAYETQLLESDLVIYRVASIDSAQGDGELHFGVAVLSPGRIGDEYFMTKGHLHAWRPAAEVYVGLSGEGAMLLEDEQSNESRLVPLVTDSMVYVPGHTAHRTINTGDAPMVYIGIYPARAGHDYAPIAARNFHKMVIAVNGDPVLIDRADYRRPSI